MNKIENIQAHFTSSEHLQCHKANQVQGKIQQGQCAGPLKQLHENLGKRHMEERDAQSSVCWNIMNITAQGGNVFAPILNNVQGAGDFTFHQSVTGAKRFKSETRDVTAVMTEYKESVVSMYTYTREYDSLAGEQVLLADRYVDPLIITQHRMKKEREEEMRSKGNDFFNLKTYDINQSISASNLFSQEHGPNNDCPKAVILQGNSGSGKSFITQKIMLDWAEGNLFAGIFDAVFHLRCAELNVISEKISLVELLNCSEEMIPILKDKQKRILFLMDGFDELRCSLPERPLPATVYAKAEPGAILSSLLRGTMLKDAFLLVTTRSTSTEKLGKLLKRPQRFTEIMGFSEKGVEEYFQKFFKDTVLSKEVHEQVKAYNTLYTACFSPVMCWLICTSFKQKSNMGTRMTSTFKSTTSIFIDFVFVLLEHHCQDLNQSEKFSLLKHLGQLAEDAMRKGEILFARQVVPEIILNRVGLPFLCTFTHKDGVHMKEMFSFLHLSFQEFFAALFYILQDKTEGETKIKQLLSDSDQFYRMAHLFPVIQFLFGLCNKEVINSINEKHELAREIGSLLVQWMQAFVKSNMVECYSTFPLHCLHEVNDENVVKNVMKNWETGTSGVKISLSSSQISEYHAAAYCLQFCRRIRCLDLHADTVQTLQLMEAALTKCEITELTVDHVSDDDVDCLILAVRKVKGNLQFLRLYDGSLSDDSVQMIMSHLHEHRPFCHVLLPVKAINHNNTEILMDFFRGRIKRIQVEFRLNAATSRNKEKSLSSHFVINNCDRYKIRFEHKDVDSSRNIGLALGYLALDPNPVISKSDLTNLLTISDKLKESDNLGFEEHVDALLSFLRSKPELTAVMLKAKNLSLNTSAKIVTFLQDGPERSSIWFKVHHLQCINGENICSLLLSTAFPFVVNCDKLRLEVHSSSFQDSHGTESNPELLQLSLMFPPIKAATVNWVDLFQLITQMMKSEQRTSFTLENQMNILFSILQSVPTLKNVTILLRSLPESWEVNVISFFLTRSTVPFFELRVNNRDEALGMTQWECQRSSDTKWKLCFGCGNCWLRPVYGPNVHEVLPCITLTMTKQRDFNRDIWVEFFHHYNQLKAMTELCLEHDECLVKMLNIMKTIPYLQEVKLALRFLTIHWAVSILHPFQTSFSLWKIDLDTKHHTDLCSELGLRKSTLNKCRLFLRCNSSNPDTKAFFGYISLTVCKISKETESWRSFFQSYYETKGLTERDPLFAEKTSALLSSLYGVPGLEEVEFSLHSRSDRSVSGLLWRQSDGSCPCLTIKRNVTDSTVTVKIHRHSNPPQRALIHLKVPCSEISNIDVAGLLCRLGRLKHLNDTPQEYDVQVNELISFLHSVPHLQKLKLEIEKLTSTWVTRVLSFKTCHSLQKIFVDTKVGGMLSEEIISEFEKNWTCQDCVLVLIGERCSDPTKKIKLSFHGGHYSEELFLQSEKDSEWEENINNRFACYSD